MLRILSHTLPAEILQSTEERVLMAFFSILSVLTLFFVIKIGLVAEGFQTDTSSPKYKGSNTLLNTYLRSIWEMTEFL